VRSRAYLLCILALVFHSDIFAANNDTDRGSDSISPSATKAKHEFALWCRVGSHTFYLERTTLAEIVEILKKGTVKNTNSNDPGNADPLWAVPYRDRTHVILFLADGDMGGPQHTLTGIEMKPISEYPLSEQLPMLQGPIDFDFGAIGMPLLKLEQRLGRTAVHDGAATYQYEGTQPGKDTPSLRQSVTEAKSSGVGTFDITAYLYVGVKEGKIDSIELSHITTF
jgi:hypothetical protein